MKVICPHCREKSTIRSSNRISAGVAELYCQCENGGCDCSFVMTLAHKHDTRPPKNTLDSLVEDLVRSLSPDHRQQLLKMLSAD